MRKDCRYTNMSLIWANEATNLEDLSKVAAKERTKGKFDITWCFSALRVTKLPLTYKDVPRVG